jgi:DNA-directed RNA polymerase subunit RPC12/RpoP
VTDDQNTWPPFTREEGSAIQKALATPHTQVCCPRCGEKLTMKGPIAGGGSQADVWQFRCIPCSRAIMVRDLPEERESDE